MPIYALGDQVPSIHQDAYVHPDAVVIGAVTIGANSSVWPGAVLRGDDGEIRIGQRTSIQDNCVLHTTTDRATIVGDDCVIGHMVHLEACTIEPWSLIGNGSIVLHRVVVCSWAIVAAKCGGSERHHRAVRRVGRRNSCGHQGGSGPARRDRTRRRHVRGEGRVVPYVAAANRLMQALVVSVDGAEVEVASDVLWSLGVVAIEERVVDDHVELWTSVGDDLTAVTIAVGEPLARWSWRLVEVDETVAETWRTHAKPVWIDSDLVICPAWVPFDARSDVTVVRIEPGPTFGLGDHPTTRLSLRAVRSAVHEGATVLDVGCGSGVLAVASCLLGAAHATAIDISPASVPTTMRNAAANGVVDRVEVSTKPLAQLDGRYDVVVANILAPVLIELAEDLRRLLAPSGLLIVSGVLADRHEHVEAALRPLHRTGRETLDGWAAITFSGE